MALPDLSPSRTADELHTDILRYVVEADAIVAAREPLSLAGLDTAVETLCGRVLSLSEEEARAFQPKIIALLARIDVLQENMIKLRGEIATTLNSMGKQKKASQAYSNAPSGRTEEQES